MTLTTKNFLCLCKGIKSHLLNLFTFFLISTEPPFPSRRGFHLVWVVLCPNEGKKRHLLLKKCFKYNIPENRGYKKEDKKPNERAPGQERPFFLPRSPLPYLSAALRPPAARASFSYPQNWYELAMLKGFRPGTKPALTLILQRGRDRINFFKHCVRYSKITIFQFFPTSISPTF